MYNTTCNIDSKLINDILQLMLDSWNQSIFSNIKQRLQDSAMKLLHAERNGEAFDSQLVIGVRESYGKKQFNCSWSRVKNSVKMLLFRYQMHVKMYWLSVS